MRGAFARSSSAASGFFFCGMMLEPEVNESPSSRNPNSSLDQSTISAPSRERCIAQIAAALRIVEHEVAVRDRVERVLRDALESELLGDRRPARVPVHARQRSRAERQRGRVDRRQNAKRSRSRRNIQK